MFRSELRLWKHVEDLVISVLVAAAVGLLTPASARGQTQTIWTVKIDVTHQGGHYKTKPTYSYTRTPGSCPDSRSVDPLYICLGDIVHWVVESNKHKDSLDLLLMSYILKDNAGNPTATFHADDGSPTNGGETVNHPTSAAGVKYNVLVRDKDDDHEYPDDPKLIIGTGNNQFQAKELLNELKRNEEQLRDLVKKYADWPRVSEARDELEELRKIIDRLGKDLLKP